MRRRLARLERPIHAKSNQGRIWTGYVPYHPAHVAKVLDIMRTVHNSILAGKGGKRPAPRLGLTQAPVDDENRLSERLAVFPYTAFRCASHRSMRRFPTCGGESLEESDVVVPVGIAEPHRYLCPALELVTPTQLHAHALLRMLLHPTKHRRAVAIERGRDSDPV